MNSSSDSRPDTASLGLDPAIAGYAAALLELAAATDDADTIARELAAVFDLLDRNPEICDFLASSQVRDDGKRAALDDLLRGRIRPVLLYWILILVAEGVWPRRREAAQAFYALAAQRDGSGMAEVVSATPLTAAQLAAVERAVGAWVGRPVRLQARVDPEVIGGLSVRVGDRVIDGTVAHRLEGMKEALLAL